MTLHKLPARELAEKIAAGSVSSKEATQHFIDRIEKHNPGLTRLLPRALTQLLKRPKRQMTQSPKAMSKARCTACR